MPTAVARDSARAPEREPLRWAEAAQYALARMRQAHLPRAVRRALDRGGIAPLGMSGPDARAAGFLYRWGRPCPKPGHAIGNMTLRQVSNRSCLACRDAASTSDAMRAARRRWEAAEDPDARRARRRAMLAPGTKPHAAKLERMRRWRRRLRASDTGPLST